MKFKEVPGHVFLGREGNPSPWNISRGFGWSGRGWCSDVLPGFLAHFLSVRRQNSQNGLIGIITHCSHFVGGCCHIGMIRLGWVKETILPFQLDYWTVDRNVIPGTGSTVEGSDLAADFLSAAHEQEETHGSLAGTSTTVTSIQMAQRWWHAVTWPSYGHGCVITSYPYYKSVWLCLESETYHFFVVIWFLHLRWTSMFADSRRHGNPARPSAETCRPCCGARFIPKRTELYRSGFETNKVTLVLQGTNCLGWAKKCCTIKTSDSVYVWRFSFRLIPTYGHIFRVCPCALMGRRSIVSTYSAPALVSVCLLLNSLSVCSGHVFSVMGPCEKMMPGQNSWNCNPSFLFFLFDSSRRCFPGHHTVSQTAGQLQLFLFAIHHGNEFILHSMVSMKCKNPFSKAIIRKVKVYYGLLFDLGHHFGLPKPPAYRCLSSDQRSR